MYDGDNDEEKEDKISRSTRHPTAPLQLQGGNETPQVETVTEENSDKTVDTGDTRIVEDEKKERRRKKRTARQIRS